MLKIFIEYKGKIFKYNLWNEYKGLKIIRVLITDKNIKNSYNHHFICNTKTGNITIPSTSNESGFKESAHLNINFKPNDLEVNDVKFDIPIHSIYELGQNLPTNLNFTVDFNV